MPRVHKSRVLIGRLAAALGWVLVAVAALSPRPALAGSALPGIEDPAYQAAVALWLDGNDEESLPELARLAADGNIAARFLLPHIEALPRVGSTFLEGMPRPEARALFRAPGGLSGTSWLKVLADDNALAALLLASRGSENLAENAAELLAEGERRAANAVVLRAMAAGDWDAIFTLVDTNQITPEVRHAAWHAGLAVFANEGEGERARSLVNEGFEEAMKGTIPGVLFIGTYLNNPLTLNDPAVAAEIHAAFKLYSRAPSARRVEDSPERIARFDAILASYAPYRSMSLPCESLCPSEPRSCMRAAYAGLGGHDGVVLFGSPLERLLPSDVFASSRRGEVLLMQSMAALRATHFFEELRSVSPCLASAIEDLRF